MKPIVIVYLFVSLISINVFGQKVDINKYKSYVMYLASDSLKGRKPGTNGADSAAVFIQKNFHANGVQPLCDNYLQVFSIPKSISVIASETNMQINKTEMVLNSDFTPLSYSENGTFNADAVFIGNGSKIKADSTQDFKDKVKGKWVIILKEKSSGMPKPESGREKSLTAKDMGAIGVIFINPDSTQDVLFNFSKNVGNRYNSGLAAIQITNSSAKKLFYQNWQDFKRNDYSYKNPLFLNINILANIKVIEEKTNTYNVVGIIPGTDSTLKEYIIIGAHYDHLGYGGEGSGSRNPDLHEIHNGADDNASGTAALIEIASMINNNNIKNKRTIILVAFSSEESGLLGSKFFTSNIPMKMGKIVAMFNMDMIGRMKNNALLIGGSGTSVESDTILKQVNKEKFILKLSPEGFGPSDHASFYTENIPVFFITTGPHSDYHLPVDDYWLLNYKGIKKILSYSFRLIMEVSNRDSALTFKQSGPSKEENTNVSYKVTLGIIPDMSSSRENGLGVDGVRENGPAAKGGIKKDDIITAIEGKPVKNIYEYMHRLNELELGKIISVEILRKGRKQILLIQL